MVFIPEFSFEKEKCNFASIRIFFMFYFFDKNIDPKKYFSVRRHSVSIKSYIWPIHLFRKEWPSL